MPIGLSQLDRVQAYTVTTGTGTVTLGSATPGYQTWSAGGAVNNQWYPYLIQDVGNAWELGYGQYNSSTPSLTRTVEASSNGGALLSLSGGATVACTESVSSGALPNVPLNGYSVPPLANFTFINQSTATAVQNVANGCILMTQPSASLNWRILEMSQPSTPYKIKIRTSILTVQAGASTVGLYFYDGTKLLGLEVLYFNNGVVEIRVEEITNVTTDGSTVGGPTANFALSTPSDYWLQIRNDGTTLNFDWSLDPTNFNNLFSQSVGTYLTPTKVGWGGVNESTSATDYYWLKNWSQTPNVNLNGF